MRTKKNARHIVLVVTLCLSGQSIAQCDVTNHNGGAGFYLGWNAGASQILDIQNNGNQPIDFYTHALQRMRLYNTRTFALPLLGGGTVNVRQNGYLAICPEPNFYGGGAYGPFSRLHLADTALAGEGINHYAQPWGYRTWMRNGITFTGNHDHAYIGQKYFGHDSTDMVIHWSDNADKSPFGPDRLRFLFTSDNTGAASGSRSVDGLEFMRMFPVNQTQGWIGVGNYAVTGLTEPEPTERLDLIDRTLRLRDFADPTLYRDDTHDRILVADATDGRVYWRHVSTIPGIDDCKWTLENAGTSGSGTPIWA